MPCSASGAPKPTIFWTHHAFNAPPTYMNGSNGLLELRKVDTNKSGEYTCQIFNGRGRRILRKTLITVFERPVTSISTFHNEPHLEDDPLELYCNVQGKDYLFKFTIYFILMVLLSTIHRHLNKYRHKRKKYFAFAL